MIEKTFKITNQTGLDAKMSSLLVTLCGKYQSKITMQLDEIAVDLKSIMGVMSLNVAKGELVKVICSGVDEEDALKALSELINDKRLGKEY
jgi:phosphocarrier protein